jgi:hypothetical protein
MVASQVSARKEQQSPAGLTTGQLVVLKSFDVLIAIRWPAAVVLSIWLGVPHLAGRKTEAIVLFWVQELGTIDAVPWLLAVLTSAWAIAERALRRQKTEYLSGRIAQLETAIDPGRTSSGLAKTGDSKRRRGT